eukprot:847774-Alexandrium_andersonii.AAC.1
MFRSDRRAWAGHGALCSTRWARPPAMLHRAAHTAVRPMLLPPLGHWVEWDRVWFGCAPAEAR